MTWGTGICHEKSRGNPRGRSHDERVKSLKGRRDTGEGVLQILNRLIRMWEAHYHEKRTMELCKKKKERTICKTPEREKAYKKIGGKGREGKRVMNRHTHWEREVVHNLPDS